MTKTEYLRARAVAMRDLIDEVGGFQESGGLVSKLAAYGSTLDTGEYWCRSFPEDQFGRALGCFVEVFTDAGIEMMAVAYEIPRNGYLQDMAHHLHEKSPMFVPD